LQGSNDSNLVSLVRILAAGLEKRKLVAKTRTELVIETSEILIVKRKRAFVVVWCEDCERDVRMLPVEEAALFTGYDVSSIYTMMQNRQIHFRYQKPETPRICLRSLCLV